MNKKALSELGLLLFEIVIDCWKVSIAAILIPIAFIIGFLPLIGLFYLLVK